MVLSPNGYLRTIGVGVGVLVFAFIFAQALTLPAVFLDPRILAFDPATSRLAILLFVPLNFIGMALACVVYLRVTGKSWTWLDVHAPDKRDLVWIGGGSIVTISLLLAGGFLSQALGLDVPSSPLVALFREDLMLILFMLLSVWLFNAPAEELLFRNIIQKRSYAAFSGLGAVSFASLLFVLVHLPSYLAIGAEPVALLIPISIFFLGSMIMGLAYLRTANLVVPIAIHGIFNSVQFLLLLALLLFDIDPETALAATMVYS